MDLVAKTRKVRYHVQIVNVYGEWVTVSRHKQENNAKKAVHTKVLVKGRKYKTRVRDVINGKTIVQFD